MNLQFFEIKNGGMPVIFLHGNSLDSSIFKGFCQKLPQGFNPVMLDLPGHGFSPRCDNYTLGSITKYLCSFINRTFEGGYIIVAHSLSGHIVLQGLDLLQNIKGLFLTGTPPLSSVADLQIAFHPGPTSLLFQQSWDGDEIVRLSALFSKGNPGIIAQAIGRCDPKYKRDFLLPAFLEGFRNEHIVLSNTKIPVYVTWTEDDPFVNSVYIERNVVFGNKVNIHYKCIGIGGHLPFLDNHKLFTNVLLDFIRYL